ncbi:MAG: Trm112 family protein [Terrimicrobiaceae bacterium]
MIAPDLLALLCCPSTGQALREATTEERKNCPAAGEAALITADGRMLYPIRNGIPLLLPSAGIPRDAG